jgi:hypothetical protein
VAFSTAVGVVQAIDLGRISRVQNTIVPGSSFLPPTSVTEYLRQNLETGQAVIAEGFLTGGTISSYGFPEPFGHCFFTAGERQLLDRLVTDAWLTEKASRPRLRLARFADPLWFDLLAVRALVGPCASFVARFTPEHAAFLAADRPLRLAEGHTRKRLVPVGSPTTIGGVALLISRVDRSPDTISVRLVAPHGETLAHATTGIDRNGAIGWFEIPFSEPVPLEPGEYELSVKGSGGRLDLWGMSNGFAFYLMREAGVPPPLSSDWRPLHASNAMCVVERVAAKRGAMLVASRSGTPNHSPGRLQQTSWRFGEARYTVDSGQPALLVRSTRHYPGWRAKVDERSSEVIQAFGALQAVTLTAGQFTVEWRYEPLSLVVGLILSTVAACVSFVLWRRS